VFKVRPLTPDLGGMELGDQDSGFGKRLIFLLGLVVLAIIALVLSHN
jgi:hypothetical protein